MLAIAARAPIWLQGSVWPPDWGGSPLFSWTREADWAVRERVTPRLGGFPLALGSPTGMPIWLQGACGPPIGGVPLLFSWTREADWAVRERVTSRLGGFPLALGSPTQECRLDYMYERPIGLKGACETPIGGLPSPLVHQR
jgi:hypothetical protein